MRLQATHTLEIIIGPKAPDPVDLVASKFDKSKFNRCYTIDDNDESDS